MKVENAVLIEPKTPGFNFFSSVKMPLLGLPILGAILQQLGINVRIFCENFASINWDDIRRADLVGISTLTSLAPRAYQLAAKIKEINPSAPIIMGGVHASMKPEEALNNGADIVVRGEGENTLVNLVDNFSSQASLSDIDLSSIKGISYQKNDSVYHNEPAGTVDLDNIPGPDFSLIKNYHRSPYVPYQTSRGCPHDCEFCSVVRMFGRRIRYRSADKVIDDLEKITGDPHLNGKHVFLVDDNFSANSRRAREFLTALKEAELNLEWSTQEEVMVYQQEEILDLMQQTGCKRLHLGIESFNPAALEEYGKPQKLVDISRAIQQIKKRNILVHGMFVLGAENDTRQTIRQTVQKALELELDTAQFFVLVPPPGTELFQKIKEEGRLLVDKVSDWKFFDGQHVVFNPRNISARDLQQLQIKAFKKFYSLKRSLKWLLRKKFTNAAVNLYGFWAVRRWKSENKDFINNLPGGICPK